LKVDATPERKQRLARDLAAAAQGPDQPGTNTVRKLAEDLAQAVGDRNLSVSQRLRVAKDVYCILNSASIAQVDVDNFISDVQALFQLCGVARADVLALAQDLKATAAEVRKNAAK
jgi:hypothetical protein